MLLLFEYSHGLDWADTNVHSTEPNRSLHEKIRDMCCDISKDVEDMARGVDHHGLDRQPQSGIPEGQHPSQDRENEGSHSRGH